MKVDEQERPQEIVVQADHRTPTVSQRLSSRVAQHERALRLLEHEDIADHWD